MSIAAASNLTGGENGLRGFTVSHVALAGFELNLLDPLVKYYFILGFVALALWFMSRILLSPFGAVVEAIRENETRARACGFDVGRTKLLAFVLSGLFCGLAGAMSALHLSIVPLDDLGYTMSGTAVMMTLLGGVGTFFGPFIGAFAFLLLEDSLSLWTSHWQLFLGVIFILLGTPMSDINLLEVRHVSRKFSGFTALDDISVGFEAGKITAVIGPNGAGKSTFFNILSGALKPSNGHLLFKGRDISQLPQHEFAHIGIARSYQITTIFPQFTAHENAMITLLEKLAQERTILLVEHKMKMILGLSDRILTPMCGVSIWGRVTDMLKLTGLNAWYGPSHVLHNVGLEVRQGEIMALIGRNGAGKTTTMKAIMGLLGKTTGSMLFEGVELASLPAHARFGLELAYVPEDRRIVPGLTVRENLRLGLLQAKAARNEKQAIDEIAETFPRLRERIWQLTATFRIAIAPCEGGESHPV
eukprot:gene13485-13600_t